jgi:glyoxylase-like metal-dependent hydrolase (beta-lactamase superfamily II)
MPRRVIVALCSWLFACAPPAILVPEASVVARTERRARAVEVCRLDQELDLRPLSMGVNESTSEKWHYVIGSIVVKHPSGLVVIDPAFGTSIKEDLGRAGPLVTMVMGTEETKTPLVKVMKKAGLDPADVRVALVTHAHWDHVGALGDLPNARVLMSKTELEWTKPFRSHLAGGVMTHMLKRAKRQLYEFEFKGPAVDGFESSYDVFGDGSIIGVPMPGHTPGSTAWLVRGKDVTYLFSGDTSWTYRGVQLPAHKAIRVFDDDLEALSKSLGVLNAFVKYRPDVVVVPAHDGEALEHVPACAP